jgi:hypothetical protein
MGTKTNAKDANDALKLGLDMAKLLDTAAPIPHKQIITFSEMRDQVCLMTFKYFLI